MADFISWDLSDLREKSALLLAFDDRKDGLIAEGITNVMNRAAQISATKFIVGSSGGSRDPFIDPPNPPPGPLKTRSGDLRRGITVLPVKKRGNNFVGGLGNTEPYAPIHELGGTTPPHFIEGDPILAFFSSREGQFVFRESVNHPGSRIPPRPFLTPAIEEANDEFFDLEVTRALVNGIREIFGEGAVGTGGSALLGI